MEQTKELGLIQTNLWGHWADLAGLAEECREDRLERTEGQQPEEEVDARQHETENDQRH